jgi:hypothetical protein
MQAKIFMLLRYVPEPKVFVFIGLSGPSRKSLCRLYEIFMAIRIYST